MSTGGNEPAARFHRRECSGTPLLALETLRETILDWDGEWNATADGGDFTLPVRAGLRYGLLRGHAFAARHDGGSELTLEVRSAEWRLNRAAVVMLLPAAAAAVGGVLWPFFPALTPVVPFALLLGAGAWLAVLARLRHQGPAELLEQVADATMKTVGNQ